MMHTIYADLGITVIDTDRAVLRAAARGIRCTSDPSGPPRSAQKGQIRRRFAVWAAGRGEAGPTGLSR